MILGFLENGIWAIWPLNPEESFMCNTFSDQMLMDLSLF